MDPCEIAERYLDSTGENSAPRRARSTKFSHAHSGQRNRDSNFHAVCACYHCSWIPLMMPTLRARFESHLGARIKPEWRNKLSPGRKPRVKWGEITSPFRDGTVLTHPL